MTRVTRFQIVLLIIFVSFTIWINAKDIRDDTWTDNIIDEDNKTHWINCTINGTIYYDDDCFGWMSRFLMWMGGLVFGITLLFCCCFCYCLCTLCRICCCSERPREVIYTTYVYPSNYYNPYSQLS